jgi:hypothetical protein
VRVERFIASGARIKFLNYFPGIFKNGRMCCTQKQLNRMPTRHVPVHSKGQESVMRQQENNNNKCSANTIPTTKTSQR